MIESDGGQIGGLAGIRGMRAMHFDTATRTWGTGLAVDEIMMRLAAAGMVQAWLRVFEDNLRAISYPKAAGFSCLTTRRLTGR